MILNRRQDIIIIDIDISPEYLPLTLIALTWKVIILRDKNNGHYYSISASSSPAP